MVLAGRALRTIRALGHKMEVVENIVEVDQPQEQIETPENDDLHVEAVAESTPEPAPEPAPKRNPRPSKRGDKPAPAPTPAPEPAPEPAQAPAPVQQAGAEVAPKRGRGRPKKNAEPAKKAPQPAGADVNPQRAAQVDAIKGLLQLRASKIASLACMVVGWEQLNQEEEMLVDAEFEGWTPPPEARKAVVLAVVALPRALADNRIRSLVGLPSVGGGDDAAQRAEAMRAQQQAMQAQQQAQQAAPVVVESPQDQPQQQDESSDETLASSPLFNGQSVKVPKGFV